MTDKKKIHGKTVHLKISADGGNTWNDMYCIDHDELRFSSDDEAMKYCRELHREFGEIRLVLNEEGETMIMMANTSEDTRQFISLFIHKGFELVGWYISAFTTIKNEIEITINYQEKEDLKQPNHKP